MTPEQLERFETKYVPDPNSGCWLWFGLLTSKGYGRFGKNGKRAHRISYMSFVGPIPLGMCVCHRCDQPSCVNPSHLFLGTVADNQRDMQKKGRWKNGRLSGPQHGMYGRKHSELTRQRMRKAWVRRRANASCN